MAQAKTRTRGSSARTKSANGNRSSASSARSKSSSSSSRARSNGASARKTSGSSSKSKRSNQSRSPSRSRSPQSTASKADEPKGALARAKTPLVAGGAALIGLAGGAVAARNSNKRRSLPMPNLKKLPSPKGLMPKGDALSWIEGKAKTMGDAGYRVAELSSDAQKVKKNMEK